MGRSDVRNPERLNPWQKVRGALQPAGFVRAIEQRTGSILVSTVELGSEPFFSFIPLPDEAAPCSCEYGVSVRIPGREPIELLTHPSTGELSPPPDTVVVDLGDYAGRTVDLLMSLRGTSGRRGFWGSPAVYGRGERERKIASRGDRPNVVLIGVDTLRADALGAWGHSPSRTPAIDGLAGESDRWIVAESAFNVTVPSFTSILSGLYGRRHGVYDHETRVPKDLVRLPKIFSEGGYDTAAFLGARHLAESGLGDGFGTVVVPPGYFRGETPVDEAMSWISLRGGPFFCWVHLYDPHTPHTPPGRFALGYGPDGLFGLGEVRAWKELREPGPREYAHEGLAGDVELYAAEVSYVDRQMDRLLDYLRSSGLLENTIVVFVADHGENLEDHGIRYGHAGLWETTVHVPLMIRWPGRERTGREIAGLVQTIDLFPTLLAATGLPVPEVDGRDLRQLEREGGRRAVFAEHAHGYGEMIRTRDFRYMRIHDHPTIETGAYLYDLRSDPGELVNLAGKGREEEGRLAAALDSWMSKREDRPSGTLDLDDESRDQLRALGYLR